MRTVRVDETDDIRENEGSLSSRAAEIHAAPCARCSRRWRGGGGEGAAATAQTRNKNIIPTSATPQDVVPNFRSPYPRVSNVSPPLLTDVTLASELRLVIRRRDGFTSRLVALLRDAEIKFIIRYG